MVPVTRGTAGNQHYSHLATSAAPPCHFEPHPTTVYITARICSEWNVQPVAQTYSRALLRAGLLGEQQETRTDMAGRKSMHAATGTENVQTTFPQERHVDGQVVSTAVNSAYSMCTDLDLD